MVDVSEWITDNARLVIAVMVVASAVVAAGVPMVDRSTSLDQFQTDADEADALDYVDANFSSGSTDTTSAQVIVRDDNVLDKDTLVSILEYERALETNETVNETLVENDSTRSVANLVATTSIREDRAAELQTRERELTRTEASLAEAIDSLANNPNASVRPAFEAVDANTSVTLTEADYRLFADAVEERRAQDETGESTGNVTKQILADEYATLAEDRNELESLDPTLETQIEELRSLNDSEVEALVADVLSSESDRSARALAFMPDYYEPGSTETNATLLVVTHESAGGSFAPGDAPEEIEDAQATMTDLAPDDDSMAVLVYGDGVVSTEITDSMIDSVLLVGPLAIAFVLLVLVVVYRDLLDILLGLLGIALVLVWTFGAMGWFDIAFSQPFIVVLVLLIGLSIDYGLHVVMRYREARESSETSPSRAMAVALGSVGVALVYVTTTTVIGFLSNLTSPLGVFRELGVVSAIGIVATLLVFGLLVPALKVELDELLERRGIDRLKPAVGTGGGPVSRVLGTGATLATKAPYVVIAVALLVSATGAYGATGIDASFEQSDFLAEDPDDWLKDLPDPIAPGTYTAERAIDTLDRDFVRQDTTATILVRGDVTDPVTLDRLDAARTNASDMSATETYADGEPAVTDPITVMDRVAADNASFNRTLAAADTDGDGVPDENVTAVYDELYRVAPEEAADVVHREDGEYRAVRMVVTVDSGVDDDVVHDQMGWVADDADGEGVSVIATGDVIVNQITADQLAETALLSLVVALLSVVVVLAVAYRLTEGSASLGVVTIVPVAFTLTWVLGTMALLDIPFNIVTGMITGLTIGLGVDYSLHISERFNQELAGAETVAAALHETVTGTGGALLSSAATTASGFAVLLVAILPFLQSFGLITALTIVFAFLASVFVLPSLLVVWARVVNRDSGLRESTTGTATESPDSTAEGKADVTRTVHRSYLSPDQVVPVTVSLRNVRDRMILRESVDGEIGNIDLSPEPVAVDRDDGTITVYWNIADSVVDASLEYTVELPAEAADGDVVTFEGTVESSDCRWSVGGDETATVVEDIFQRVLERGAVTAADIEVAIERDDITPKEVARLRRAWLKGD
ncbi:MULTISPECIES: efflux RND transporter permease subunit [Haloferacaceae]|uniref:Predicted exporter protein, RND superfamily n=3 Tax=Halobacteriales TaxID=2235 RepID=A0A1H3HFK2_9EURY|nr:MULTISPECIES: MMPL family transporter [Haloferacaceae]SDY14005.1 Predicted exporter protein, RND superfamily [Halobellus clavatus]